MAQNLRRRVARKQRSRRLQVMGACTFQVSTPTREGKNMHGWQIVEEPDFDRISIINVEMGCTVYLPRWSHAQIDIAHAPRESGIHAELLSYQVQDACTYSLTHGEGPGETCTPPYLLEVWMNECLVLKLQLPFACGEQLRHTWLEKR